MTAAEAVPDHGYFRGTGGAVIKMDLPLPVVMQDKVTRHELIQVNQDGSTYEAPAAPELGEDEIRRPGVNALKPEWVGYAVSQGMSVDDADAMTKNDLIDKYNK